MGGLIRAAKTARLWYNGEEKNALFVGSGEVWRKPLKSIFNNPGVTTTDDIVGVGSSDMGCIHYSTWNQPNGPHSWYGMFRDNYQGSLFTVFDNETIVGSDISNLTYGRVTLRDILRLGRNGEYSINAEEEMDDFNALVMEFSDWTASTRSSAFFPVEYQDDNTLEDIYSTTPIMYNFPDIRTQKSINEELYAILEYTRAAREEGINRLYLCGPWPRLVDTAMSARDQYWRARCDMMEEFMHFLQDRVNYQLEKENLGGHVSMVPYYRLFARIYDDIQSNDVPEVTPALDNIRRLFANYDNMSANDPLMYENEPRHWYMLNHWGAYVINCLYAYVVLGVDPRGFSNSAGNYTIPLELATYFQNIAVEVAENAPRTGKTRTGDIGYIAPTIRDTPLVDLLGTKAAALLENVNYTGNNTYDITNTRHSRHYFYVFDMDESIQSSDDLNNPDNILFEFGNASFSNNFNLSMFGQSFLIQDHNYVGGVLTNFRVFDTTGNKRIYGEARYYPANEVSKQGHNFTTFLGDGRLRTETMPQYIERNLIGEGLSHDQATSSTFIGTRIRVPETTVTLRTFISTNEILSDGDAYNVWRAIAKTHQMETWDLFTPDMVQP